MALLRCGPYRLDLAQPRIMAILNVTPDSFSGDGVGRKLDAALRHAERAIAAGAHILDVGGESTRPGAVPVGEQEELDRVIPVIEALAKWGLPISVDTFKPAVMREAIAAGAAMVNDIYALSQPGAVDAVAASEVGLCLMHMQGRPATMQLAPSYASDVVDEVVHMLFERVAIVRGAGISDERIVLDPGFGFGKSVAHNYSLLKHLNRLVDMGLPVLAALSRKSMLGAVTGTPPQERGAATLAGVLLAVERGARIVRVHDVAPVRDALQVWQSCVDAE